MKPSTLTSRLLLFLPSLGIFLFVVLYVYATTLYPGGSQAEAESVGFSWVHNYWCNLMNVEGINGMLNPARPVAIAATILLCLSLLVFFFQFANHLVESKIWKGLIKVLGSLSMVSVMFIYTAYHDILTIIASVFGLVVVIGIIRTIYRSQLTLFKISGILCMVLLFLNNLIYYSEFLIEWLPLLQKITFAVVLCWIIGLNLTIHAQHSKNQV